jgi:predicted MPP superfamily phosphohydrolase
MPLIEKIIILAVFGLIALIAGFEFCFLLDFLRCRRNPARGKSAFLSKPGIFVHVAPILGLLCLCYGFFIEAYWVEVNEFVIPTSKLKDTSFRVVHISDMHCDTKMRNEKKLVEIVNALKPDVIVFTGDAINTRNAIGSFKETMAALEAGVEKLAVRGNWFSSVEDTELFASTGFKVLGCNKAVIEKDGEKVSVYGLNFWNPSAAGFLLGQNSADEYNVFLYHTPDLVEDLQGLNVDMYLTGHTHGGQICLPFYGAIITFSKFGKKYESGNYKVGQTELYVNRGVGMEGGHAPRARFFARPEVAVFDIVPEKLIENKN